MPIMYPNTNNMNNSLNSSEVINFNGIAYNVGSRFNNNNSMINKNQNHNKLILSKNQMKEIIQTSKKKIMRKKKGKKENKIRQMIKTTKQNISLYMSVREKFWKLNL